MIRFLFCFTLIFQACKSSLDINFNPGFRLDPGLNSPTIYFTNTQRASEDSSGVEGNAHSSDGGTHEANISSDGRYVVFFSDATNLVVGDTNAKTDVFVKDVLTQATTRVSVATGGVEGNNHSTAGVISGDGSLVVFESVATNLVAGDTNGVSDIFLHNRSTGITTRVSVDSVGTEANGDSSFPVISGDGTSIIYSSSATNLVAGDTNGADDVFKYVIATGITTRVSLSTGGVEGDDNSGQSGYRCDISQDGKYVVFDSDATNLVLGDTNGITDIFVRDTMANTTVRVSISTAAAETNGISFNARISSDGLYVVFQSAADNLVAGDTNANDDVFIRDTLLSTTDRVSVSSAGIEGDSGSFGGSISEDGNLITFYSDSTNLVAGDTNASRDVFLHKRSDSSTVRISLDTNGLDTNNDSELPEISDDGRYVVFQANASDIVASDTNAKWDVFSVYVSNF